jgi:hypothetical protein
MDMQGGTPSRAYCCRFAPAEHGLSGGHISREQTPVGTALPSILLFACRSIMFPMAQRIEFGFLWNLVQSPCVGFELQEQLEAV